MRYRGVVARTRRIARFVATGIALGWLAYTLTSWFLAWNPADARAYYLAAERLRDGAALYPAVNPEAHEVFRYAPWFAVAWLPMTLLPIDVATHAWSLAMLACAFAAAIPVVQLGGRSAAVLAALMVALLAETAMLGNAQPLVVALHSWTSLRPSAGVWVGVAASMKLAPILFVAGWVADGRWRQALIALATMALLFAPMLAFDLSNYVTSPGTGLLSVYAASPALWAALAVASLGVVAWLAVRRSPAVFAAAGIAMFLVPPRVSTAYLAFVLPGLIATVAAMTRRAGAEPATLTGSRVADVQRV
jgi:alpha-1,2-mannosyltransferase